MCQFKKKLSRVNRLCEKSDLIFVFIILSQSSLNLLVNSGVIL